ncbi:hypothetical protein NC652_001546 [Populus alba x Populus x berolinensis]|uniref:Uncharacterized protein n=3 Tax=Populus TaxID=3689 RepID=A0A8X8DHF6_POPTO|nr:uncharacterized protein LOC118039179 [Populus alba]KAG6792026.1 hypothetical protein POTOM_001164 [Populus tomentosa]KAJ6962948.1 hypothetical protein NC652_001546 [Populus alba x Populus x berolinensis]KAJ7011203.1 hypothetical protein NC653_001584 [Populus alba x Populus x berolinensis]
MDCLVLPVSMLRKCCTRSRPGYRPLTEDGFSDLDSPVTVVVGKEKKEFLVDPFVLEESPFRVLIETVRKDNIFYDVTSRSREEKKVIFVDVDAILFEHMLWLMYNDSSSLFQLNLKEIIDFYAQDR